MRAMLCHTELRLRFPGTSQMQIRSPDFPRRLLFFMITVNPAIAVIIRATAPRKETLPIRWASLLTLI